jgi:hypothetical protein
MQTVSTIGLDIAIRSFRSTESMRAASGRPEWPLQDRKNKTVAPIVIKPPPSSSASTADRLRATESLLAKAFKSLLQQNLPVADRDQIDLAPRPLILRHLSWGRTTRRLPKLC